MRFFFIILFFMFLTVIAEGHSTASETEYQEGLYGEHMTGPQAKNTAINFCKFERFANRFDEDCMSIASSSRFIDAYALGLCRAQPFEKQLECLSAIKDKVYSSIVFKEDRPGTLSINEQITYLKSTGIIASKVPYLVPYFADSDAYGAILNKVQDNLS